MRKQTKTIMAFLTAMTMTAGTMGVTAYAEEANTTITVSESTQTDGVFSQGAKYHFIKGSDALVIDGSGSFTAKEFKAAVEEFSPRAVAFGNDVVPPEGDEYEWMCNAVNFAEPYVVYINEGSKLADIRKEMIAQLTEKLGVNRNIIKNLFFVVCFNTEESVKDFVSMFTYEQVVLDKEAEIEKYLIDKGINEDIAKKSTGIYLNGLNIRVRNYYDDPETNNKANLDGTEVNERTKTNVMSDLLRVAKQEQQLLSAKSFSEYTDELSELLKENGKADDIESLTLGTMCASKSCLARSHNVYFPEEGFTYSIDPNHLIDVQPTTDSTKESIDDTEKTVTTEPVKRMSKAAKILSEIKTAATLKGDADVNGTVELSDIIIVAKYNLNDASYPLVNETAYANADINGDKDIDGLDTSALIENQLGKKDKE